MWLCGNCEKIPSETIYLIGQNSKFRVHWFCMRCDKPALKAIRIPTNSVSDEVIRSLNKVVDNVTKAVNEIRMSFENHCKTLEEKLVLPAAKEDAMDVSNGSERVREGVSNTSHKLDNYEKKPYLQYDHKYNVIIFGIAEPPSGSSISLCSNSQRHGECNKATLEDQF